jgi:hypothetical protein
MASSLFEQALPTIVETTSPRAWAFALIGIHEYLHRFNGDRLISQIRDTLAERLANLYQANRKTGWHWYENELAYCNAVLPLAMLVCGESIPNATMTADALESLNWLATIQRSDSPGGHFTPIGSNGFYPQNGERAHFDQRPRPGAVRPPVACPLRLRHATARGVRGLPAPVKGRLVRRG